MAYSKVIAILVTKQILLKFWFIVTGIICYNLIFLQICLFEGNPGITVPPNDVNVEEIIGMIFKRWTVQKHKVRKQICHQNVKFHWKFINGLWLYQMKLKGFLVFSTCCSVHEVCCFHCTTLFTGEKWLYEYSLSFLNLFHLFPQSYFKCNMSLTFDNVLLAVWSLWHLFLLPDQKQIFLWLSVHREYKIGVIAMPERMLWFTILHSLLIKHVT
jgi:hypothetical protein